MQPIQPITTSLLNRKDDLTIEEVRAMPRYQDWTDEELTDLVASLKTFTEIIYSIWAQQVDTTTSNSATLITLQPSNKAA